MAIPDQAKFEKRNKGQLSAEELSRSKSRNSFSGTDITVYISIPPAAGTPYNKAETVQGVLGTLQTISYSIHREVVPVRALGKSRAHAYTRGPRCIPASEKVYIKDRGLISISDVNEGDLVQTGGFEFHRVNGAFDQGTKECKSLKLENGYNLIASCDHPVFTDSGWVKMGDLKKDDIVYVCGSTPSHDIEMDVDDDVIKMIAYLIGDGSIHRYKKNCGSIEHRISLTISDSEMGSIGAETCEILKRMKIPFKDYRSHGSRCVDRRISVCIDGFNSGDRSLIKYNCLHDALLEYGLYDTYSHTKFIPNDFVCGLSNRQISIFLNRLFSSDGGYSVSKCKKYIEASYITTSELLSDQVRLMLNKLGINSIKSKESKVGKVGGKENIISRHDAYKICISNSIELSRFIKRVNIFGKSNKVSSLYHKIIGRVNNEYLDIDPIVFWNKVRVSMKKSKKNMSLSRNSFPMYNYTRLITPRMALRILDKLNDSEMSDMIYNLIEDLIDKRYDFIQKKVVSVLPAGELKVFDLEVDERHSFICNHIKVHNTIAGTMVWTTMDQYVLASALEHNFGPEIDTSTVLSDQLPPLDIVITFANEWPGEYSKMVIAGVRMVNEGSTLSIDDMLTEQTNTYIATDIDLLHRNEPFRVHKDGQFPKSADDIMRIETYDRIGSHRTPFV